jgi:hypothetical protein
MIGKLIEITVYNYSGAWRPVTTLRVVKAHMSYSAISLSRYLKQPHWLMGDNLSFRDVKAPWCVPVLSDIAFFITSVSPYVWKHISVTRLRILYWSCCCHAKEHHNQITKLIYTCTRKHNIKMYLKYRGHICTVKQKWCTFYQNLLRIQGLYMFRGLLVHPQEAQHKRHLVNCVRGRSVGYTRIKEEAKWCSQLTTQTQYTKWRLWSASWGWTSNARNM